MLNAIILTLAATSWIQVQGGAWTPSPKIMVNVRENIQSYVTGESVAKKRPLEKWSNYTFQYLGRRDKTGKYLFINATCGKPSHDLSKVIRLVEDGGTCHFTLKYNSKTRTFSDLYFNFDA